MGQILKVHLDGKPIDIEVGENASHEEVRAAVAKATGGRVVVPTDAEQRAAWARAQEARREHQRRQAALRVSYKRLRKAISDATTKGLPVPLQPGDYAMLLVALDSYADANGVR